MDNQTELPPTDELAEVGQNEENITQNSAPATAKEVGIILEEGTGIDDEIDDEADIEGAIESSVQIAPTDDTNPIGNEENPMLFIQLGDRVVIDSKKYGRTIGNVYYRSLDIIRVKPDGVSNTLHDFELEQTEDEELYKEEDGVIAAYVVEKRKFESFVEQQDYRINQIIDTFDSNGEMYKSYKIIAVDKENDNIQIQDLDDEDNKYDLNFDFIGISLDEDFTVISIRQLVGLEEKSIIPNEAQITPVKNEDDVDEDEDEDDGEVIGFVEITRPKVFREAAIFEQRIPDNLQKIDALNDFIGGLDPMLQKDPKAIRAVRVLVETLFNLKQATVAYNDDGSIKGTKDISALTLAELIKKVPIPLGRPVLDIKKREYILTNLLLNDETKENIEDNDIFVVDFADEFRAMTEKKSSIVSGTMVGAKGGQVVKEWIDQQDYLKKYASPWISETATEPIWHAINDSEFFRKSPPEVIEEENGNLRLENTVPGYVASHDRKTAPTFYKVPFGMERALSTTYRKGVDRKKQVLIPEESATMNSYLIFPAKTVDSVGKKRSRSVAIDSGRSQMPKKMMKSIILETGGPKEVGTSNDLILLDVERGTLGNIPLPDYIEGLSIPALGIGDTFDVLEQYGIDDIELTPQIIEVLVKKIELYQAQLLTTIAKLRQIIESETQKNPEINPFLELPSFLEEIRSQPTLVEDLEEFERINPSLAQSDLGKVAYLMKKHPDYFQVAAGKNPILIAKALLNANNMSYLQALKVANLLRYNELNAGEKPKPNTCKHVADLVAVKKIYDDVERFQKLIDFFKKYQGERDNNFINCNLCKEHLICVHERLQIQAFLNPMEKLAIEKEIILKFSGGVFQGKYICRNCGQPIKDLDFDNNIEFDDDGKPKSGRAVLVDEDAIFEEKLDLIVSVPIEPSDKQKLELNDDETKIYNIVREIAERVGVSLDIIGYRTVINRTLAYINAFPKKDVYIQQLKLNPSLPKDYEVTVARNTVSAAAVYLLLEIQTKIPSYVVKYALIGCKDPGFDGYPLNTEISNKQGIEYIACAVSSIRRNEETWKNTGFLNVKDEKLRQAGIMKYMTHILTKVVRNDMIQAQLAEKRKYLADLMEKGDVGKGIIKDNIPATFLPQQIIITPEEAAKDAITPEVLSSMGNKGQQGLVKLWIREAHLLAKKTASLVRGSPLSETTCCLANIEGPGTFWRNASDLPKIGRRQLVPNQQGQMLVTEFNPRELSSDVAEPNKELYYRIFLKCCFQGPRIGYSHEPGLTNTCAWCGFQFPTYPAVMDVDTEGKSALASQNIQTTTEEFTRLLDTIHDVNKVISVKIPELQSVKEIMNEFGSIMPAPLEGWTDIINKTTEQFLQLPPDADKGDIALAAALISDATINSEKVIQERLKDENFQNILKEITKLSWMNFFQVLQNYFIIPFQRILSQFSTTSLSIPIELTKALSEDHIKKDIVPILENDTAIIKVKVEEIKKPNYELARVKIKYFLDQLSAILPFKNKLKPIVVPGREITLVYIQRALLYGPLATLVSSSEIAPGTEIKSPIKSLGDPSIRFLLDLIVINLSKFKREKLSFNDKEIKELIAIRDEKERTNVIAEFNKLTDEERAVELMNKKLGLGKWAVGGTKLIYAYDKDYYDEERKKREAAGIIDFPGLGPDQMAAFEGPQMDEFGFRVYDDGEFEREGGYDHNQHGDDDYE